MPKPKTRENVLEDEEIEALLKAVRTRLEEFVVRVLLYTGLRVSELVHMRLSWVNFSRNRITVPYSQPCKCESCKRVLTNKKGKVVKPAGVWQPKTEAGAGSIPIVPEARPILEWFFSEHKTVMEAFPWRQNVNNFLKRVAVRAAIKHPVFPHALRGTFATLLASKGFDVFEVKDALRWKTIRPAIFYVRLAGERLKRSFDEKWHTPEER